MAYLECFTLDAFAALGHTGNRFSPYAHKESDVILPLSLTFAAAAALINMWLATRVGRLRISEKVMHGDGGNVLIMRRMRAQANFIEYTPIILILFALVEMAVGWTWWLWLIMAVYLIGRILHAIGMDAEGGPRTRQIGIMSTFITTIVLSGAALWAAYSGMYDGPRLNPNGAVIEIRG